MSLLVCLLVVLHSHYAGRAGYRGRHGCKGGVRYGDEGGKVGRASRSWVPSEARVRAFNMIDPLIGQKSRRTTSALNLPTVPLSSFLSTSTQTSLMWARGEKTSKNHLLSLLSPSQSTSHLYFGIVALTHGFTGHKRHQILFCNFNAHQGQNHRQGNWVFIFLAQRSVKVTQWVWSQIQRRTPVFH